MNKVLVLEDSIAEQQLLNVMIAKCGFEADFYNNVSEVLDNPSILSNASLIICDCDLVDSNTLPVLKYMKDNNINTPVVLNSGNYGFDTIVKEHGYGDLVVDDWGKNHSLSRIRSVLNSYK